MFDCDCWTCEEKNTCPFESKISRLPRNKGGLGLCPKLHDMETEHKRQRSMSSGTRKRKDTKARRSHPATKRKTKSNSTRSRKAD